jgi:hypothetical protein
MEIDRTGDARREAGCRAGGGIEEMNPATTQIGEKIFAQIRGRELKDRRVIESAADNGAADIMSVEVDRASERWIVGRAFCNRPAVVRTRNAVVDFLVG